MGVSGPLDWDAATYDRASDPQLEWGADVLERLHLRGDETLLDAGCGSGRLTERLLERVPGGAVIGVDGSPSMIEAARERLGDRVELICSDLLDLDLPTPVDAIFSNATFHWITNHDRLFARMHAALRPSGKLEAQCGGQGNVAEFLRIVDAICGDERFAPYLRGELQGWNFASVTDTQVRLERAGFADIRVWFEPKRVTPARPEDFLRASTLTWHLARLPPQLHGEFVGSVVDSMPRPLVLEFVRLNLSARRR